MELCKALVLSATYIFILLTSPAGDKPHTKLSTEHNCDAPSVNDVLQCWLEWRESSPIFSTVHHYEPPKKNELDVLQSWLELLDNLDSQSKLSVMQDYRPPSSNDELQFLPDSQSNITTVHDIEQPSTYGLLQRWLDSLATWPFWLKGDLEIAYRNVWCAAELTFTRKPQLLQHYSSHFRNGRVLFRNSLHNSRRSSRNTPDSSPLEHLKIDSCPAHPRSLIKPFFFTIGVSAVGLGACMIWEYESLRSHASGFFRKASPWINAQQRRKSKSEPGPITKWWNSLRENEKVFYPILAANVLVFGAWRVRQLQPYMIKYFCSNPSGTARCLPMLLSTFSHYSVMHLAANMYVLYSFMPAAVAALGKEQFTAMYLSAGVISSFASFVYKVLLNQPGLSLGASGAIMSVLSYVCMQYPDTRLSIIFLPMYTFAAGTAIKVIMSIDLAGVVLGWKFFDHAAHLGGALFGIYWCQWGGDTVWGNRDKFVQYYHSIRKNDSNR